jgi:hypothetical protein
MDYQWQLTRNFEARPDGQRRWDYVYQFLLQWATQQPADSASASSRLQEVHHANRHLCSRLKSTSTATPKH